MAQTKLQVAVDAAMVLTSDGVTDVMTQEMLGELVNKALAETSRSVEGGRKGLEMLY